MTDINFYSGVADPITATTRLIGKAYAQGRRVRVVTSGAEATRQLDALLWASPLDSFLPHVGLDSELAALTPVIVDHAATHEGEADVLINLASTLVEPPSFFARFERLFEVIGSDQTLADAGRERWKFFKARGYPLTHTVMQVGRTK